MFRHIQVRCQSTIPHLKYTPSKYNRITSASNLKPNLPKGLVYHPAPAASAGSGTTPNAFLPKDDPRRGLQQDYQIKAKKAPALVTPKEKTYELKPADIEEIKRLRAEDPAQWTRRALAKKFNVSPLFISMVSDAAPQRKQEMEARLQQIKDQWKEGRRLAREDRKKRKQLWYRME